MKKPKRVCYLCNKHVKNTDEYYEGDNGRVHSACSRQEAEDLAIAYDDRQGC